MEVFPTQVGMFLEERVSLDARFCYPYAGGDVSQIASFFDMTEAFSPRRWGCF